jgi:hypothetical protein
VERGEAGAEGGGDGGGGTVSAVQKGEAEGEGGRANRGGLRFVSAHRDLHPRLQLQLQLHPH